METLSNKENINFNIGDLLESYHLKIIGMIIEYNELEDICIIRYLDNITVKYKIEEFKHYFNKKKTWKYYPIKNKNN